MRCLIVTGIATKERAGCLAEHIRDKSSFNRSSGTASLSADSFGYNGDTGAYWRGAVWPPVQCVVVQCLQRAGYADEAYSCAAKYSHAFLTAFKAKRDITEFMSPDKPELHGVGSFVGWGGVAPIEFLIEDIIGIRVDAPSNTVEWDVRQLERHGIRNLHFGRHVISLICEARTSADVPPCITADSDGDFTLVVRTQMKSVTRQLHAGRTILSDESSD